MVLVGQERIIEKKGRGRERETTTHLIKSQIFTHASRVTKFSTHILRPRRVSTCRASFKGSETISKLTEGQENMIEAVLGVPLDRRQVVAALH